MIETIEANLRRKNGSRAASAGGSVHPEPALAEIPTPDEEGHVASVRLRRRKDAALPELTITVTVPWPKHRTLANWRGPIFLALMAAGRQLLLLGFAALEGAILESGGGAKQRRRRRYLLTRFGEPRF